MDVANADGTRGGAELTMAEFEAAAPGEVQIIACPPGGVVENLDRYVIGNCVGYTPEDLFPLGDAPRYKYMHDVWPNGDPAVRDELVGNATLIFCSPVQRDWFGFSNGAHMVPPPVDLEPFRSAAVSASDRKGAVALGPWMNWDKAPHRAAEVAPDVDFYGGGPCAPAGSVQVEYDQLPDILARYRTFVHLPTAIEPFGRTVVEAWAAGCKVITNRLVGARYWIEEAPDRLETAAEDFWRTVCA